MVAQSIQIIKTKHRNLIQQHDRTIPQTSLNLTATLLQPYRNLTAAPSNLPTISTKTNMIFNTISLFRCISITNAFQRNSTFCSAQSNNKQKRLLSYIWRVENTRPALSISVVSTAAQISVLHIPHGQC